jgi:hypothetical protein
MDHIDIAATCLVAGFKNFCETLPACVIEPIIAKCVQQFVEYP